MRASARASSSSSASMAAAAQRDDVESRRDGGENEKRPLLEKRSAGDGGGGSGGNGMSPVQRAISQTYQSTAHLAKLLPTGTVLAFQLLSPIVTNQGHCDFEANRAMAGRAQRRFARFPASSSGSRTASAKPPRGGAVRYGFATPAGLWVIDGGAPLDPQAAAAYRLRLLDLVHAVVSVMVFAAVALFDQNVVSCFYPVPSEGTRQVLTALPIAIGVVGSMLFVSFPTTRHGIGFPLSPR
ncbi:hypothetical protein OsJ_19546 [Oryza sativa Japonica Group]|uniref:Uncharacterized protein n=1 Tax=Oryza sativa subsp. japonica TaxID=39947 RepID=B9FLL9_ORYSJ|nr:hypothetical protein OsJ_19546 [Oryza sativa Japonica Group]